MTSEQMPFAVHEGNTVGLPADVQFFILYQGPTLPPAEVFTNVQPQTKIDVFFRAPDGSFPFWTSAPIPSTLTVMETGKVYSVRVGVDTTWVVPGNGTVPSDGVVSKFHIIDLPFGVTDRPFDVDWSEWAMVFKAQSGCHAGTVFVIPGGGVAVDAPVSFTVPPCAGQPPEDMAFTAEVHIVSTDGIALVEAIPAFTIPAEGGDFTVSFLGKSVTLGKPGLFSGTRGLLLAAAALGGLLLIGRKKK